MLVIKQTTDQPARKQAPETEQDKNLFRSLQVVILLAIRASCPVDALPAQQRGRHREAAAEAGDERNARAAGSAEAERGPDDGADPEATAADNRTQAQTRGGSIRGKAKGQGEVTEVLRNSFK